jgi:hypothetical protein
MFKKGTRVQLILSASGLGLVIRRPNCLRLKVVSARGLRPKAGEASNPAVRVSVGDHSVRSQAEPNTLNPTWNEGWAFPVSQRNAAIALLVEHARPLGFAVFLGQASLSLADVAAAQAAEAAGSNALVHSGEAAPSVHRTLTLMGRDGTQVLGSDLACRPSCYFPTTPI